MVFAQLLLIFTKIILFSHLLRWMMSSGGNLTMSVFLVTFPVLLHKSHLNSSIFSSLRYSSRHSLTLVLNQETNNSQSPFTQTGIRLTMKTSLIGRFFELNIKGVYYLLGHPAFYLFEFSGRGKVRFVNSL